LTLADGQMASTASVTRESAPRLSSASLSLGAMQRQKSTISACVQHAMVILSGAAEQEAQSHANRMQHGRQILRSFLAENSSVAF
jgi:parvulin-like peptidyl-prolyl isomerase